MKKKELEALIAIKYNKYNDLLWYARCNPERANISTIIENRKRIETEFTDEVIALYEDDTNWQHGFHSGCCAAFSYVLTCLDKGMGVEYAEEEFPFLDS
jgi:hypothetical protein